MTNYKTQAKTNDINFGDLFAPEVMLPQNLLFLREEKGFDTDTVEGLEEARKWILTADPDNLLFGEPKGDPFDIMIGSLRRGLLLQSVDLQLSRLQSKMK